MRKHFSATRPHVSNVTSYCDLAVARIGEMKASVGFVGLSWSLAMSVPLLWASRSSGVLAALLSSLKSRFFLPGGEGPGCGPRW